MLSRIAVNQVLLPPSERRFPPPPSNSHSHPFHTRGSETRHYVECKNLDLSMLAEMRSRRFCLYLPLAYWRIERNSPIVCERGRWRGEGTGHLCLDLFVLTSPGKKRRKIGPDSVLYLSSMTTITGKFAYIIVLQETDKRLLRVCKLRPGVAQPFWESVAFKDGKCSIWSRGIYNLWEVHRAHLRLRRSGTEAWEPPRRSAPSSTCSAPPRPRPAGCRGLHPTQWQCCSGRGQPGAGLSLGA